MFQYALRRLLLMPPTFFFVSVVLFIVLNLAPGRPGQQAQAQGEKQGGSERESYRIFKEQFNLDKPILFNTRFALTEGEILETVKSAHNLGMDAPLADRIEAAARLEDYGNYAVRHLIALLDKTSTPELRAKLMETLETAAKRRLDLADTDAARIKNRELSRQNAELHQLETAEQWKTWWQANREDFTYAGAEKVAIFFADTRFAKYWENLFTLNFGRSTVDRRPVLPTIISKLKYSLTLSLLSVLLAYLIAIPMGIWSAVRQDTVADTITTLILFILYSLPTFFVGTVFLRLLTEGTPVAWFPAGDFESQNAGSMTTLSHVKDVAWHLVLPVTTYTALSLASLSRYARTGLIDVIRADYIRTARAKGLSELVVIVKHAARNGMIPILTLLGSLLPILLSGSVVIEVIFNIPGMGLFLYDAINLRDYNVVMGVLLIQCVLTLIGILISDLSYAIADPRITFD